MPFVIPIFIAFSVGVLGGGTVAWKWEDIKYALKGKRIAVLGARAVGKTTLLKYLEEGILIQSYEQTLNREDVEKTRVKLKDLDIYLKQTHDVPGGPDAYWVWKNLCDASDLIFYIVRTDELLKRDPDTENRCEDDLNQIRWWLQESNRRKQFFIVGNHWSSDPEFKRLGPDQMGNYSDRFRALPVVKKMTQLAGGAATVKVVLGSLATQDDADRLITRIFQQVEK